jgi:hypothetical protein
MTKLSFVCILCRYRSHDRIGPSANRHFDQDRVLISIRGVTAPARLIYELCFIIEQRCSATGNRSQNTKTLLFCNGKSYPKPNTFVLLWKFFPRTEHFCSLMRILSKKQPTFVLFWESFPKTEHFCCATRIFSQSRTALLCYRNPFPNTRTFSFSFGNPFPKPNTSVVLRESFPKTENHFCPEIGNLSPNRTLSFSCGNPFPKQTVLLCYRNPFPEHKNTFVLQWKSFPKTEQFCCATGILFQYRRTMLFSFGEPFPKRNTFVLCWEHCSQLEQGGLPAQLRTKELFESHL